MSDEDDHKITVLPVKPKELRPKETAGLQLVINDSRLCLHGRLELDTCLRKVTCGKCGAVLDPFDALAKYARFDLRMRSQWQHYMTEIEAGLKRLKLLKRMENNAKARLKRMGIPMLNRWTLDDLVRDEEKDPK